MDSPVKGWRRAGGEASLSDVHRSIAVATGQGTFRRAMAFFGPGYLVAVGYMAVSYTHLTLPTICSV